MRCKDICGDAALLYIQEYRHPPPGWMWDYSDFPEADKLAIEWVDGLWEKVSDKLYDKCSSVTKQKLNEMVPYCSKERITINEIPNDEHDLVLTYLTINKMYPPRELHNKVVFEKAIKLHVIPPLWAIKDMIDKVSNHNVSIRVRTIFLQKYYRELCTYADVYDNVLIYLRHGAYPIHSYEKQPSMFSTRSCMQLYIFTFHQMPHESITNINVTLGQLYSCITIITHLKQTPPDYLLKSVEMTARDVVVLRYLYKVYLNKDFKM